MDLVAYVLMVVASSIWIFLGVGLAVTIAVDSWRRRRDDRKIEEILSEEVEIADSLHHDVNCVIAALDYGHGSSSFDKEDYRVNAMRIEEGVFIDILIRDESRIWSRADG